MLMDSGGVFLLFLVVVVTVAVVAAIVTGKGRDQDMVLSSSEPPVHARESCDTTVVVPLG